MIGQRHIVVGLIIQSCISNSKAVDQIFLKNNVFWTIKYGFFISEPFGFGTFGIDFTVKDDFLLFFHASVLERNYDPEFFWKWPIRLYSTKKDQVTDINVSKL